MKWENVKIAELSLIRSIPGSIYYRSDSALLKAEHCIGMTNEAVTPYTGPLIHYRLHKSIVEHYPCMGCKTSFRTPEKNKSLADFLSGLFYVFVPGEAAVKIYTKQFGAADSLYNLILESDF